MDRQEFCSLYETYKNGIFRYVLSIMKDRGAAEDVLQETFLKVLTGGLRCTPGKEQTWLYRVARNLCYDHLRKAKREETLVDPVVTKEDYGYLELIASLSPKDQEIVSLKIIGGLTHREIGNVLGISPKAAQKRYERAIAALRKED